MNPHLYWALMHRKKYKHTLVGDDMRRKEGNHMVDLPQPEMEQEECECEWEHFHTMCDLHWRDTDVDVDGTNVHVTLTVRCRHCEREIETDCSWEIDG